MVEPRFVDRLKEATWRISSGLQIFFSSQNLLYAFRIRITCKSVKATSIFFSAQKQQSLINTWGECERGNADAMLPAVSITPLTLKELLVVLKCLADKVLRLVEGNRVWDIPA